MPQSPEPLKPRKPPRPRKPPKPRKPPTEADELFWDCAAQLHDTEGVRESTMFGFRCLRIGNEFVAMPADNALWLKLPESRVSELIESGVGEVCAPAGRPFREWVRIRSIDETLWLTLLRESLEFVRPR